MKVFFTGALQDKEFVSKGLYAKIYKEIESAGYEHVDDEVVKMTSDEYRDLKDAGREVQLKRYNHKVDSIKKADICIFESSSHSLSTGFLINVALEQQKPTIVLYYEELIPFFLSGVENDKMVVQSYNEKTLKKVISAILEQAREKRDKRFNFFISPKLLEFLEKTSNTDGITKSKYIRNLIVEHMRQNKTLAESPQE